MDNIDAIITWLNSSSFFVEDCVVKRFTIELSRGYIAFTFDYNIRFWASDFVATWSYPFYISCHRREHSICACCPLTLKWVCLHNLNIFWNRSGISTFSLAIFVALGQIALKTNEHTISPPIDIQQNFF